MQKTITSSAGMLCHEAMVILWKLKFITMRSWINNPKESWKIKNHDTASVENISGIVN